MKTEEAIEFVNMVVDGIEKVAIGSTARTMKPIKRDAEKVITLLKQGEADSKELKIVKEELKKVWQMWGKFYKEWGEYPIELHNIAEFMDITKQKYFPKEVKGDGR